MYTNLPFYNVMLCFDGGMILLTLETFMWFGFCTLILPNSVVPLMCIKNGPPAIITLKIYIYKSTIKKVCPMKTPSVNKNFIDR